MKKTNSYFLSFAHRKEILLKADNPSGKICRRWLQKIEYQRKKFVHMNGNAFGQRLYSFNRVREKS
jgi:hypothetical protein